MFQSRSLRSSPGTYLRCSLNSTEKPWKGLACRPERKPSTMNLARRSSRATWRMTSGRRYFSVLMGSLLRCRASELAAHLVKIDQGSIHHSFAGADFDRRNRRVGAIATFGSGLDGGKILLVIVAVP